MEQHFWSLEAKKNYANPEVHKLLTKILKRKEISEWTKKLIEDILSGRGWGKP